MLSAKLRRMLLGLAVLVCAVALIGCAAVEKVEKAMEGPACAGTVVKQISKEAELAGLECSFKKFDGVESLWYKVTVKNVSNEDQRFRVNIFLDSGKAVGGLIPRKTNKGLVKPGASMHFSYPVKGQKEIPAEATVIIKTMSK